MQTKNCLLTSQSSMEIDAIICVFLPFDSLNSFNFFADTGLMVGIPFESKKKKNRKQYKHIPFRNKNKNLQTSYNITQIHHSFSIPNKKRAVEHILDSISETRRIDNVSVVIDGFRSVLFVLFFQYGSQKSDDFVDAVLFLLRIDDLLGFLLLEPFGRLSFFPFFSLLRFRHIVCV